MHHEHISIFILILTLFISTSHALSQPQIQPSIKEANRLANATTQLLSLQTELSTRMAIHHQVLKLHLESVNDTLVEVGALLEGKLEELGDLRGAVRKYHNGAGNVNLRALERVVVDGLRDGVIGGNGKRDKVQAKAMKLLVLFKAVEKEMRDMERYVKDAESAVVGILNIFAEKSMMDGGKEELKRGLEVDAVVEDVVPDVGEWSKLINKKKRGDAEVVGMVGFETSVVVKTVPTPTQSPEATYRGFVGHELHHGKDGKRNGKKGGGLYREYLV